MILDVWRILLCLIWFQRPISHDPVWERPLSINIAALHCTRLCAHTRTRISIEDFPNRLPWLDIFESWDDRCWLVLRVLLLDFLDLLDFNLSLCICFCGCLVRLNFVQPESAARTDADHDGQDDEERDHDKQDHCQNTRVIFFNWFQFNFLRLFNFDWLLYLFDIDHFCID